MYNVLFSVFWKKKRNKTKQIYINNQNQETFIVIIINYKLRAFLMPFHSKYYSLKNTDPKNWIILPLFCRPTDWPYFFAVLPVDQKTWFRLKTFKSKENFIDNHGHSILRRFDILPNFLFSTSEMEYGYS